jgi:NAD(P)H-nitrite reductase large subunit
MKHHAIVCRCEDITEQNVIDAIHQGYTDLEELRRKLRIGMGPCQGRVCISLVKKILEKETGKKVSVESYPTSRPPVIPISLGALAKKTRGENETKS